ncbi:MAG: hypothetical protein DCE90_09540 [Pseudanabaena sp.]|nr:MAG: hypothetical protein DCE90_09540 [Pseudanabaena sp.]
MNSEQQQQRIIGYFIEEAREHLQTIEQGVLNLQNILGDSESINEVFRAAHSIKGGAAMLGVGSVQHVAHRLEDFFKIIKDTPNISVDERLTSLLLAGFDPLEELLDELQDNFKVSEESTNVAISRVKPIFNELEIYLNQLVSEVEGSDGLVVMEASPELLTDIDDSFTEIEPIPSQESVFQEDVTTKMRDMLQLFRSEDNVESRSQLQEICNYFQQIGNQFNLRNWAGLATQVKNAIAQPTNSYRTLAPILIRELKESQDLVLANREDEIVVSAKIQSLLPYRFAEPEDDEISTIFTTAASNVFDEPIIDEWQVAAEPESIEQSTSDEINPDVDIDLFADSEDNDQVTGENTELDWIDGDYEITDNSHIDGPKVGASELKSLAVLFENDDIDFESAWEDIESNESQMQSQGLDDDYSNQDDFADLLTDELSEADNLDLSVDRDSSPDSNIDQLFGEFSTDDSELSEGDSLFPEDVDIALDQSHQVLESEISDEVEIYSENTPLEFATDAFGDDSGELDLSVNITEDISEIDSELDFDYSIDDSESGLSLDDYSESNNLDDLGSLTVESSVDDQGEDFNLDFEVDITDGTGEIYTSAASETEQPSQFLTDFDEINLNEPLVNNLEEAENGIDESESLSSEAFFASLTEQEGDITFEHGSDEVGENELISDFGNSDDEFDAPSDEVPNDPFALTTSEESMTLLEDPFMVDDSLDQVLLENLESLEESPITQSTNSEASATNTDEVNIFDELGFDSDDLDNKVETPELQTRVESTNDELEVDNLDLNSIESDTADISAVSLDEDDQESEDFGITEELDSISALGDFFDASGDADEDVSFINITDAGITDVSDEFNDVSNHGEVSDGVEAFYASDREDIEQPMPEMAVSAVEISAIDFENNSDIDYEVSTTSDLEDFFAASEVDQDLAMDWVNVSDSDAEPDSIGIDREESRVAIDLNTEIESDYTDSDDFSGFEGFEAQESNSQIDIADSESSDEIDNSFDNFASDLDFADVEITDVDSTDDLLGQVDISDNSDLVNLFTSAREDDLTLLENSFDFDEFQSPIQLDEDSSEQSEEFDFSPDDENTDITVSTTLDNLADFFQGEDEPEVSVTQESEMFGDEMELDLNFDMGDETDGQFDGLDDLGDFEEESNSNRFESISTSPTYEDNAPQETYSRSQGDNSTIELGSEELNGIDDDFNFDDLEEMIGNQSMSSNSGFSEPTDSQDTNTFIQDSALTNADEMNFDELEALLGEPTDLPAPLDRNQQQLLEPEPSKPSDDFDELENMLQSAFAKDVGPIKTKTINRPPATARKQRLTDSTMRVDVKYLDSLNNLVGELVVNRNLLEQDQERLQQFITNLLHQVQLLSDVSQKMRDEYDKSLLEASLTAGRSRSFSTLDSSYANDGGSSVSSVSRDFEGIEFDRYNKFHILSQEIIELIVRVRESASDIEFVVGETDQVTRQLGTITTQIQDDLKQSRMVPFAQIADRLPRGIRDRALKTGKQAELEIFGRETLIDKAILESLTDPLTHLVNNAIDHGLEDPATRQASGKSGSGHLIVRAYHQGNQTVISISDDGAGIDPQKVKKSAVAKRVRTQSEVDKLNDTEVYALLFEAGFSTAAQADEFKGRGVGLDVVKTCLDDIRGVIIVESEIGRGTTFTIRLPLTLSISKAMFCISDRARIAFPVDGFEDMVEVPQSQIILNEKGQPCLPWRDTLLPFQHLSNLLAYSRHLSRSSIYGKQENDELCIIILRNDTNYLALQVDQFLGEYEIVIKQLEGPIPQPAGIAGATVLGDGRVMAIANVLELFDIASGRLRPSTSSIVPQVTIEEDVAVDPTVLIVDDSITVRELLSLTFAKVGYRVEQAKDGQDAWEKLRAGLPCDMIFCDIEMPRMDGLDLLSRLQKDTRLKDIPVAMLTSRGADRHRQSAIQLGAKGYFTKPYLEEELLSASKRLLAGETLPI